jgi:hypothetical protein
VGLAAQAGERDELIVRAQPQRCGRQTVRPGDDHPRVLFLVRLICSDVGCAERAEEIVASLAELEGLACDCGCTFELLAVSLDAVKVAAA